VGPDYTKAFIPSTQVWSGCHPAHVRGWPPRPWPAWATAWPPPATPPPRARDTPPLAFKVHLDAMTRVVLDGLAYVRVGRAVGSSTSRFASACTCRARWSRSGAAGPRHLHHCPAELGDHLAEMASRPTGARQARHVGATL